MIRNLDTYEAPRFDESPIRRARPLREELSSGLLRRLVRDSVRMTNDRLERVGLPEQQRRLT